jgi:hypothetical protein
MDVEHAALKCFNSGDGARAHDPINDEWPLRWLDMGVKEFLHQENILCPIEAPSTDGCHNSLHLKRLSMLRCGGNVALYTSGHTRPNVAYHNL